MFPEQITIFDPNDFSRCDERRQIMEHGKSFASIETDVALKESIYHAFWKDHVLRAIEYEEIDVFVKNGVVYLNGHIVNATNQSRVMKTMQTIPGISRIENDLVLDDKLTLEIATSLGKLEHIYDCKFFTGTSHGVVSLNGSVSTEDVKLLAEQCASSNPNVRAVINNVRVAGTELVLQNQPFLQPVIGELIYFLDGVVGSVKQVVINPNNRRVIQLIIQGQFSNQKQNLRSQTNNQPQQMPEMIVVMPVNLIRYLTSSSGFLTIKSTETTQYQDFNPLYFSSPPTDWKPPYPYCPGDVLFNVAVDEIENQIMVDPDIAQLNISAQPTSPQKKVIPVDTLASWEDDGGQIVQTAETVAMIDPRINVPGTQTSLEKEKHLQEVNDSLGG